MEHPDKKLKFKLIVQSYTPLFVLILIKYFDFHIVASTILFFQKLFAGDWMVFCRVWSNPYLGAFFVSILSIGWIISGLIAMWQFKDAQLSGFIDDGSKISIDEELTDSSMTFFMTFVFPLLLDNLTTIRGSLLFIGILALMFSLMWKTNLYYQNPILTVLGYKVYKIHFQEHAGTDSLRLNRKLKIAICRKVPVTEKIVKWKYIADDVVLIYNKNA